MFTGSLHQFQPVASAAAAANDTIAFTPMLALTDNSVQTTGEQTFTFSRHYSFKDPIRLVYGLVDLFGLVFGLILNILLIYLIKTKTVASMRIYSRLLIMTCVMDIMLCVWTYIVEPIPCVDHGYRMILLNGNFRNAAQPIRYAVYLVWIQMMLFFLITTMSQYVYRYCILCRHGQMPATIFWFLIVANIGLNLIHGVSLAWADYPRTMDAQKMAEVTRQVTEESGVTDLKIIAFVSARDFRWILHLVIMFTMFPLFYAVIVLCYFKIRQSINSMDIPKLREYNKQVSRALLFQAFLPTLEVAAWCIQITAPLLFPDYSTVMAVAFSDVPIHLAPVLNPLGAIILVAPYRRAVLGALRIAKYAKPSGGTTKTVGVTTIARRTFIGPNRSVAVGPTTDKPAWSSSQKEQEDETDAVMAIMG